MDVTELGERIRTLRSRRAYTQQQVASALNISAQAVSKWERGENAPDLFLMPALAAMLSTTIDDLMGYDRRSIRAVEGTVMFTSLRGYTARGETTDPEELALYLNGHFYAMTEAVLQRSGLPIKYLGDASLAVFIAGNHRQNAVEAAMSAHATWAGPLGVGIASGRFYLGPIGHPDFARPDVIGDCVNLAARLEGWAGRNTRSGIAASQETVSGCSGDIRSGAPQDVEIKGKKEHVMVCEILVPRPRESPPA